MHAARSASSRSAAASSSPAGRRGRPARSPRRASAASVERDARARRGRRRVWSRPASHRREHSPRFRRPKAPSLHCLGMKKLVILGATGSIGEQALEVVAAPTSWPWSGLAAGRGWERRARAGARPRRARGRPRRPRRRPPRHRAAWNGRVLTGEEGIRELIAGSGADLVLNGIVGSAGLGPDDRRAHRGDRARAGQQGEPGGGRRAGHRAGGGDRHPDHPGRLRALGALPAGDAREPRARSSGSCSPRRAARSAGARTSPASRPRRRSRTPPGRWGAGSRSTRRR